MRHRKTITIPKSREQVIEEALHRERAVQARRQWYDVDLIETVQPDPKPYVKPKKEPLTLIQIIQFPKQFLP